MRRSLPLLTLARIAPLLLAVDQLPAQETDAASSATSAGPPVTIESVRVEPENPGPETLCKLFVELKNHGTEIATQLGFTVELNDEAIDVYDKQLYMLALPPGETTELRLFNFWTTETYRPMPKNGELRIDIELRESRWMKIGMEDGVEVWDPIGPVEGLPSSSSLSMRLQAAPESKPAAALESSPTSRPNPG